MLGLPQLPRTSGVYEIRCSRSGKVYVGSAANVYGRCHVHLHCLRQGTHHNAHLQRAWAKYGEKAFTAALLETAPVDALAVREHHWVTTKGSNRPTCGYNIAPVRPAARLIPRSPTYLKKLARRAARHWLVTDPAGNEHEVTNLAAFCRRRRINLGMLYRVAYGNARHWRQWKCRPAGADKATAESRLPPPRDTRFKPYSWVVTNPDGIEFRLEGLRRFCEANGLCVSAVAEVAQGKRRHHKGWTCRKEATDADPDLERRMEFAQQPAQVSAGR